MTLLLLLACPPPGPAVDSALLDSGPTEDPTPGFADVSVGYWQTCAITSDGRMTCWGESPEVLEAYGWTYLGDGDPKAGATWAKVELSNAAIDTEASQSVCALDVHGQVTCWGALFQDCEDAEDCWPSVPFSEVSVGLTTACGLTASGEVHCWAGPLGSGTVLATDAQAVECDFVSVNILHDDGSHSRYVVVDSTEHGWRSERLDFTDDAIALSMVAGAADCVFADDGRVLCSPFGHEVDSGADGLRSHLVWTAPQRPAWVGTQSSSGGFCGLTSGGELHCDADLADDATALPGDVAGAFESVSVHPETVLSGCGITLDQGLSCWGDLVRTPANADLRWAE